jgi:hypothetical protein
LSDAFCTCTGLALKLATRSPKAVYWACPEGPGLMVAQEIRVKDIIRAIIIKAWIFRMEGTPPLTKL